MAQTFSGSALFLQTDFVPPGCEAGRPLLPLFSLGIFGVGPFECFVLFMLPVLSTGGSVSQAPILQFMDA